MSKSRKDGGSPGFGVSAASRSLGTPSHPRVGTTSPRTILPRRLLLAGRALVVCDRSRQAHNEVVTAINGPGGHAQARRDRCHPTLGEERLVQRRAGTRPHNSGVRVAVPLGPDHRDGVDRRVVGALSRPSLPRSLPSTRDQVRGAPARDQRRRQEPGADGAPARGARRAGLRGCRHVHRERQRDPELRPQAGSDQAGDRGSPAEGVQAPPRAHRRPRPDRGPDPGRRRRPAEGLRRSSQASTTATRSS